MRPTRYCAVCGCSINDYFGFWTHDLTPADRHAARFDIHRENGYDEDMSTRNIRAAELALREAEQAVAQARLNLHRAEATAALPKEPTKQGATIRFKVRYRAGELQYTYIALRIDGGWMLTGKRYAGKVLSWADIVKVADRNYSGRPHFEDIT